MYYVTMQITFLTRKFRNVECHLHCDVVRITNVWVSSLTLDCNGVFAIMAYSEEGCDEINNLIVCSTQPWRAAMSIRGRGS